MAAADGRADRHRKSFDIYWTRDESVYNSDSETERKSFAPGVDQPIKKKRDTRRMKPARETVESRRGDHQGRSKAWDAAPNKPIISSRDNGKLETKTPTKATAFQQKDKPSLKDLCPEDKKRIANLIKELAKVGEEKEVIVQQLSVERRAYEERVKKLHQQLAAIVQERELTHKQYLECQKLLAEYQSQLASEQEKVAASLYVASSPLKFNSNPQPAALQKVDNVPMAKDQSFIQPSTSWQRAPPVANQQVVGQKATQMHPDRTSRAPHQNGFQYPKAHPEASNWYPVPIPQSAGEGWKQPLGAQPPLQPGTQRPHPSSTQLPPSDPEFNPLLASTHRPQSSKEHRDAQEARFRDKSNYSFYQDTTQHRSNTHQYNEVRNQGFSYSGDDHEMVEPMDHSGEFRPLKPEMDFENQIEYYPDTSSWNHNRGFGPPSSTVPRITPEEVINGDFSLGNTRCNLQTAGALKPAQRNRPEVHRNLLEQQRDQLRKEQAWLQQKLHEQEIRLLEKQRQLAAHQLNPLEREWQHSHPLEQEQQFQNHPRWQSPVLDPQSNGLDIEWEEPNILNNSRRKISSGSENDSDSEAASTNFPPDGFGNHLTANRLLEDSIRRLNLDHNKHKNRNAHRTNQEDFRRYASLYPESNTRSRRQGSTSSATPSTLSSPNSQPALVDQSTSQLYHDSGTATVIATTRSQRQGSRPDLSPGRVRITPAPEHGSFVTLQDHRSMAKRAVSLPSRPGPYRDTSVTRKSNVTHLSDIIAEMESPTPRATTHARPINTSYNTGPARQGYPTTPDLLNEDQSAYTDTDAEQQETKILEDVFFL